MPSWGKVLWVAELCAFWQNLRLRMKFGEGCVLRASFTLVCGTLLLLLGQAETEVWHFCVVRQINVRARKGSLIGLPQQDNDVLRAACRVLHAVCVCRVHSDPVCATRKSEEWVACRRATCQREREIAQLKFITMGSGSPPAAAPFRLPLAVAMTVADTV